MMLKKWYFKQADFFYFFSFISFKVCLIGS
jgi:hypothetical protein